MLCACVRACVCACVGACVRACVRVCVCVGKLTDMFTKQNSKFTNTLCFQNKTKQKVYRYVMFTDQYKTKRAKQNKSLQIRYVYKTKQNRKFTDTLCLLKKTKHIDHVL